MEETGKKTGKRPGRFLKVILVVSLALNLLVVGLVAGAAAFKWHAGEDFGRSGFWASASLRFYVRHFEKEDRERFFASFKGRRGGFRASRAEIIGSLDEVIEAIEATPFSRGDLERAFGSQRGLLERGMSEAQAMLVDSISGMSPESRNALARNLRKRADHMRH